MLKLTTIALAALTCGCLFIGLLFALSSTVEIGHLSESGSLSALMFGAGAFAALGCYMTMLHVILRFGFAVIATVVLMVPLQSMELNGWNDYEGFFVLISVSLLSYTLACVFSAALAHEARKLHQQFSFTTA